MQKHLIQHKPQFCLEIGSGIGFSGLFIAQQVSAWGGEIYTFEISQNRYTQALHNVSLYKTGNIKFFNLDFKMIDPKVYITHLVDFAFIDANKSEYDIYLQKILPLMAPHGTILLDDVIKFSTKMEKLYGFLEKMQIKYSKLQLDEDDGVIIIEL